MNKRVGGLTEFEFEPLTPSRSLSVTIAVSGWLSDKHNGTRYTHFYFIIRTHSFPWAAEFRAEPRNLPFSTKF